MDLKKVIKSKLDKLLSHIDEKTKRLWCAVEAESYGYGGISMVSESTGVSRTTIYEGLQELKSKKTTRNAIAKERIRKQGGGRKKISKKYPEIKQELELLVDPFTRGDPESPLLWTCKSTYKLSEELKQKDLKVSQRTVCDLLNELGYSLQSTRKINEGSSHPDRDAQFNYIYKKVNKFQLCGQPVISVDAKKKEPIGEFKNSGKEYHLKGDPVPVNVYDFVDKELGKVAPYGIYDQSQNVGFVNVGINHDTAEFAVESIRRWWKEMGHPLYKKAKELLVTADGGGSNGSRNRLWKYELQKFSNETGLTIHLCHFPPATSKWNKIEHRMFCHISNNWRGRPLISREVVINLIANTKTKKGLKINAMLDKNEYVTGKRIDDSDYKKIKLTPAKFHGEWNYKISPNNIQ